MKDLKVFLCIIFTFVQFSSFSQINDITWQKCLGTSCDECSDKPYGAAAFNDGYLFGIIISHDEPWITNYHGPEYGDAWIVHTDSVGNILWERCYGGSMGDGPKKIIPIDNERVYLLNGTDSRDGDVHNYINDYYDLWVVKINKTGDIIWEKCYGGPNVDEPRDALLTPDGGLLLMARISAAGGDISQHYGLGDVWICKIDSIGTIQWEKTLGNQGHDNAIKMKMTSDTTFVVLAGFNDTGGMVECEHMGNPWDGTDVWIVEMDIKGNITRQLCYGGSMNDLGRDIVKINNGYVFVAASESSDGDVSGGHGGDDFWVVKIDNNGSIIWQKCLGGSKTDYPKYIYKTEDAGYIIMGNTTSYDGDVSGNHTDWDRDDIWVVKIDSEGNIEWEHCYGGMGNERFFGNHSVIKKSDYHFIIAGRSQGITDDVECELNPDYHFSNDTWIINIKDCSQYQPTTPQQPTGKDYLCVNTDSITTYTTQFANGAWAYEWQLIPEDAGILTQDSLTIQIHWSQTYEGPATIKVCSSNDCGESAWSDSLTVQTYMCLGTEEYEADNKHAVSVYPNPASSELTVGCSQPNNNGKTKIEVLNIHGKQVFSTELLHGTQQTKINVANLASGLYIVRVIIVGKVVGWRKVVVE